VTDDVTAVITTRGDVDMSPVLDSLEPVFGDRIVVWDNSEREVDMAVYGYFAALREVTTEYAYTQADDALVDAGALLRAWTPEDADRILLNVADGDTPWISFGGLFRKDLPNDPINQYIDRYHDGQLHDDVLLWCEVIFCEFTTWRNVDLGKQDLPWCAAANRMWTQPTHYSEQQRIRERAQALLVAA
jgi:hypothetical protein